MNQRVPAGMLLAFLTLWAGAGRLHADDRFLWRSWGVRDGLSETYSRAVSVMPDGRVYDAPGGILWTATLDALKEYRDGKWSVRYTPPAGRHVLAAVPVGRRVMVLLEDGLREFDPEHQSWREIRTAQNSK